MGGNFHSFNALLSEDLEKCIVQDWNTIIIPRLMSSEQALVC